MLRRKALTGRTARHVRSYSISAGLVLCALSIFIWSPPSAYALDGRWMDVEGVTNFRDMGGYPAAGGTVKTGVLFRSDDLSKLSPNGVQDLKRLGIKTAIDVREGETQSPAAGVLAGSGVTVVRLPMHPDPIRDKNDYYKRMIVNSRESLVGLLVLLSDKKNLPVVIFDTNGIDEVDVAAQIILLTLRVPGPDVVSEYLLSNTRGAGLKKEWGEIIVRYFDEYGGMDYYTTKILGLSSDQIGRIRENLIIQ